MIEFKGTQRFGYFFTKPWFSGNEIEDQGAREDAAVRGTGRRNPWLINEEAAVDDFKKVLKDFKNIDVFHAPMDPPWKNPGSRKFHSPAEGSGLTTSPWFNMHISLVNGAEPIPVLAGRFAKLLTSMSSINPLLSPWYTMQGADEAEILTPVQAPVEKAMNWWLARKNDPAALPFIETRNCRGEGPWQPEDVAVLLAAGRQTNNHLQLHTAYGVAPVPRLVEYKVFKQIMFAAAGAFDVVRAFAGPVALDDNFGCPDRNKRPVSASWMILLPHHLAAQITPPPQAITQTRADGSLFMAATDETFDVTNPAHLAVCKAMMEAIEPVNKW